MLNMKCRAKLKNLWETFFAQTLFRKCIVYWDSHFKQTFGLISFDKMSLKCYFGICSNGNV